MIAQGFVEAFDRWLHSPFRRKHYDGRLDTEAIQWAISLLEIHPGVKVNPNSQMWLDRLRANLHPQTRAHSCHWPGCSKQVPPAMWGCRSHWFMLPKSIRDQIWRTYRPGQEKDFSASREYLDAAREAQRWIKEHYHQPQGEQHEMEFQSQRGKQERSS